MRIEEVAVSAIVPDANNPREDFGDIAAMAASFALNADNPGEPVNPIVVVRDGGICRIVDGERRWRAMCAAGTETCHAVVCDGMDEANAMVAMLATDDKKGLTDAERSRGVQQMLLLGVDDETAERAGRMERGSAAKVRRARRRVGSAGDQMSLGRMLAIAEFDEAGDAEAVAALSSCREDEWERTARDVRAERELAAEDAAIRVALEEAGVPVEESKRAGAVYAGRVSEPETAAALDARDGMHAVKASWGAAYDLYAPADEGDDPAQAEIDLATDDMMAYVEAAEERRMAWFAERMGDPASMPAASALAAEEVRSYHSGGVYERLVGEFEAESGAEVGATLTRADMAFGYMRARSLLLRHNVRQIAAGTPDEWTLARAERHLGWCRALQSDGYEPGCADGKVARMIAEAIGARGEEEEEI